MTVQNHAESRLRRIASAQNALVKELRRAFRQGEATSQGAIAIEGVRIIEEALRSGVRFQAIFFSQSGRAHAARLLPQISAHTEALSIDDAVFSSAVSTETPQGVAALVMLRTASLETLLEPEGEPLIVGVSGIQDPGNLGTIIRSAEAFYSSGVLLGEKTVSHFNPKVVRASAGSIFREPLVKVQMLEAIAAMKERGLRVIATSSHKGKPLDEADFRGPVAVLIGNEGAGLAAEILNAADEQVSIAHSERVESLNAGIAASIVLYEAARQRSKNLTN
jgi:TrmH family RNA methyltransferase